MNMLINQRTIPPAWSLRFTEYFATLKEWIERSAYPALIQGPIKTDPTVTSIPSELARLEEDLARARPIPIALVGLTGVGKSTLLNALLEQEFLPVGVIGSQTAAFVTISYAPVWEITCEYIDESELSQIFADAGAEADALNETGSPEARERAEKKVRALLSLLDDALLPTPEELRRGPSSELVAIVSAKRRQFAADSNWKDELTLHAKGRLWPVTKTIDVRGPFEMLRSGVVISDLPGTGDLNRARANQAASAIKDAGQILMAADTKLLQTTLMDQLEGAGRLPHRLFMSNEEVQLVLVGTGLDKALPNTDDDPGQIAELGLDPGTASEYDVFSAVCAEWSKKIRPLFAGWLRTKAFEFLSDLSDDQRQQRVDQILSRVVVVPTSSKDWARHKRGKKMKFCRTPDDTGLPALRELINAMAKEQIATTEGTLARKITGLRDSVLASVERSESALGADIQGILDAIERSHSTMKEVQDRHVQIVDDLRLSVLERFRQTRETLGDKIQNAALKMRDVGLRQIHEHLADLHWASLRATVKNDGFWTTKNGRSVNLRDAIGGQITRLVPQAWSRIADERIAKQIEESKTKALSTLTDFTIAIKLVVDSEVPDSNSRRTVNRLFDASLRRAETKIERSANRIEDLLGKTSHQMQQRVDEAVDLSLAGVCNDCSTDSGTGWKQRSVNRIIDGTADVALRTEQRCTAIADEAFEKLEASVGLFCKTAVTELEAMSKDIPDVLRDAIRGARLSTPESQRARLGEARTSAPPAPQFSAGI